MSKQTGNAAQCEHKNFESTCAVTRLTDDSGKLTGFTTDISIHCRDCFKPFEWIGVPGGYSPVHPCVSADGLELRAPIKPII